MNLSAVYHRCLDNYCYCLDEDYIIISIRTDYDVSKVTLYYGDPFKSGIMGGNHSLCADTVEMTDVKRLEKHLFLSLIHI